MRNLIRLPATLVALTLALSSCTTMEAQTTGELVADTPESVRAASVSLPSETGPGSAVDASGMAGTQEPATEVPSGPTLYRGTDELIRMPKEREPVRFFGEDVSLNFEQAPLTEVVHAVMGDILELDYVVEHPIGGEVTLRTRTPVPRDQLLDILESLLKANGALMLRDDKGRFFVSGSGQMSRLKPSVAASASGVVGFSTIIVPLQFISASSMADILRPVAEEGSFVRIDNLRNILMLAGTRSQLLGWQEMIETFDVDMLKGMSVGIFPIENSSLEEMETALASLLGTGGADGEGGDSALGELSGIGSVVRIIPVPRLSSILVVTPRAHYLQRIKTWIERLDQAPAANYEKRLYVYKVQNSNADHLAALLSEIYGGTGGSAGKKSAGVAPGFTPETVTSSGSSEGSAASVGSSSNSAQPSNYTVGGVTVVADDENNALLIYATGREYRKIEPALQQLDVAATQVIIEASIVEVSLDDSLEYGLEWAFNNNVNGGNFGVGQLVTNSFAAIAPGFSYSVLNSSGRIKAVLNVLAEKSLLNVISSPSVMVLDNHTATIQVGDQVPINGGSIINDNGFVSDNITYKDIGVQLTVTPSVNAGGMVTMDIEQSVTDINEAASTGATDVTFLERKITSRIAVRSSESIVLGGLIRENKSSGSSGVPLLHEIPVLGALFGAKKQTDNRTELLVIITPRAIYSDSELRDVSREMRSQMRGLKLIDESETSAFLSDPKLEENAEPIRNR